MLDIVTAAAPPRRPRVLPLGSLYAGHRTRFGNLRAHTAEDGRVEAVHRHTCGWE